jgi:hypothetical protein
MSPKEEFEQRVSKALADAPPDQTPRQTVETLADKAGRLPQDQLLKEYKKAVRANSGFQVTWVPTPR